MRNKEYMTIQVPKEAYLVLKEYCDSANVKMGKFVGNLILSACVPLTKKAEGNILRVEKRGE